MTTLNKITICLFIFIFLQSCLLLKKKINEGGKVYKVQCVKKDGTFSGKYIEYDKEDKIAKKGNYKEGKPMGKWFFYIHGHHYKTLEYTDSDTIVIETINIMYR